MKRIDLEKLGLTAETIEKAGLEKDVIDKIMALHGTDIEAHKAKVEAAENSVTETQKQLETANATIEEMKKLNPEELQKKADEWKSQAEKYKQDAEQAKKDADDRVTKMQFDNALVDTLKAAKVKDPKEILPHLDMDIVTYKDGKFTGLDEQVKSLQESKDYLFDSESTDPKFVSNTQGKVTAQDKLTLDARKAMGLPTDK